MHANLIVSAGKHASGSFWATSSRVSMSRMSRERPLRPESAPALFHRADLH